MNVEWKRAIGFGAVEACVALPAAGVVFGPSIRAWATGAGSLAAYPEPAVRPAEWAQPISRPGVPNLHRVTGSLYRGGQPTAQGMRELKAMGIRTVLNLRALHTDRDELGGAPLRSERVHVNPWRPEDDDVAAVLRIVTDRRRTPVYVHCHHGADRTGLMCAAYRMAVENRPRAEAIREMVRGGYGYHRMWRNLVAYLEDMDVQAIRRRAGLGAPAATRPGS